MKIKFIISLIAAILLLSIALIGVTKQYLNERANTRRLSTNLVYLHDDLEFFKTEKGQLVAQNHVLELRKQELEKLFPELKAQIKDLKVKLGRAESISKHAFETRLNISTPVKDTLIDDTVNARVFHYADPHYSISGIAQADTQYMSIHSVDTLTQLVYKGRRLKPHLWIFSRRQLEQVIINSNPNTTIIYSKHIQISKD